eukprot:scaffold30906_cov89-Cyclotella_meneghiniana.AAC.1
MSHYMYIKWQGMVEIGIHRPQWSPQDGLSVLASGKKFNIGFEHFNTKIAKLRVIKRLQHLDCSKMVRQNGSKWDALSAMVKTGYLMEFPTITAAP